MTALVEARDIYTYEYEDEETGDPRAFSCQPGWKKLLILVAGSAMNFLAGLLNGLPKFLTAFGMFIVQDVFNLLVPSASGQAAITMPIMAPLADVVGITRQTAVLAYQFGDAITNCITPASGMTISCLAIAGVPLKKWWKFILPAVAIWCVVAFCFLTYATMINYGPF